MSRTPVLFISHGAPTYALAPGNAGPQLNALARSLPRPEAVLVVSPHWMTSGACVGATATPETIHDFGGFEPALYKLEYPVQGHPRLAARAADVLAAQGFEAGLDANRGLDHGAWVPMRHLYPLADVPTFQVSMPAQLDAASAFAFGRALAPLRGEGVLIIGSGSLTHNLYEFRSSNGIEPSYAREFVAWVRDTVTARDYPRLQHALELAPHAKRSHPTAEHFWPLLVAAGASGDGAEPITVLDGGFTHGVLSMESYVFGDPRVALPVSSELESIHA